MVHFKSAYSLIEETLNYPQNFLKWENGLQNRNREKLLKQFSEHYIVMIQYTSNEQVKNANEIVAVAEFLRKSIFGSFLCHQEKHAVWIGTI